MQSVWLPYLGGTRTLPGETLVTQGQYALNDVDDYWKSLTLARIGNLVFLPILVFYVYRWGAELYGRPAGVVAVGLATTSPNVLAHAGLASVDLIITSTLIAAAYHLHHWFRTPTVRNSGVAGCWIGIALMSKFSAWVFLPPMALVFLVLSFGSVLVRPAAWSRAGWRQALVQGSLCLLVILVVVTACFSINFESKQEPDYRTFETFARLSPSTPGLNAAISHAIIWARELIPGLYEGMHTVWQHASEGHPWQFLLGEFREGKGWWHYFLVALLVKTTLPFLLLPAVAGGALCVRRRGVVKEGSPYVWAAPLVILLVSSASDINIGIRHVLPMYPFLAVAASSLFQARDGQFRWSRRLLVVSSVLVMGHLGASFTAHPDYLPYFNELARGREHRVLGDSNLDWGQDLHRLAVHVKEQDIDSFHLSYFGPTRPQVLGITNSIPFTADDRPRGWVAISVSNLQGIIRTWAGRANYDWLQEHERRAIVGKTIWLYYIEP